MWRKLGRMGLLGVTVDKTYGGLSLGYLEHVLAMEAISRHSGSVGLSYGAHSNLCVNQIYRNGSQQQKGRLLPKLISGELVGALAMSETETGSDVVSMRTTAAVMDEASTRFLLNGSKMWITNGPDADVIVAYAKTDPKLGARGITAFIVEPGKINKKGAAVRAAQKLDKLGMRGSNTCEIVLENAEIGADCVLGAVNDGVRVLMSGLDFERLVLAGGPIGLMQAAIDCAFGYVHERKQFGQQIGTFQLMQGKMADMVVRLLSARSLVYSIASKLDQSGGDPGPAGIGVRGECAAALLYASESATSVALEAIQCLGGNGYTSEYPTGRILRDAKLYEIGAGTCEIRRMLIGREINKLYRL